MFCQTIQNFSSLFFNPFTIILFTPVAPNKQHLKYPKKYCTLGATGVLQRPLTN